MRKQIIWILLAMAVLIIALLLMATTGANADSIKGRKLAAAFNTASAYDSVYFQFGYPDTANWNSQGYAVGGPTNWVYYDATGLDSIGTYVIKIRYKTGATNKYLYGSWYNSPDTSAMQGAASGLTVTDIINAMIANGMTSVGQGPYQDTLITLNSQDSTIIGQVSIGVRPAGGGNFQAVGNTKDNGKFIWNQNGSGSYWVYPLKQGWAFQAIDTVTFTGDHTDTLWGAPAYTWTSAGQTTIIARITDASGDTVRYAYLDYRPVKLDADKIIALTDTTADSSSAWIPFDKASRVTADTGLGTVDIARGWRRVTFSAGSISFGLYPSSDLTPANSRYEMILYYRESAGADLQNARVVVTVPDTTSFNPFAE